MQRNLLAVALFLFALTACEQPPSPLSSPNVAIYDPQPGQRWVPPTPAEREQRLADEAARLQEMEDQVLAKLRAQQLPSSTRRAPPLAIDAARRELAKVLAKAPVDRQLLLERRAGQILEALRMDLEERRRFPAANQILVAPKGFGPDPNDPLR